MITITPATSSTADPACCPPHPRTSTAPVNGHAGNWVRAYREKHGEAEEPLSLPERARLRELERKTRELEMKCAFLTKAAAYFAAEHR
jgi:hypothetical protein